MNGRIAVLVRWLKADGEFVQVDDAICEIEAGEATAVVPAYATGLLRQLAKEGETISSATGIARIEPVA